MLKYTSNYPHDRPVVDTKKGKRGFSFVEATINLHRGSIDVHSIWRNKKINFSLACFFVFQSQVSRHKSSRRLPRRRDASRRASGELIRDTRRKIAIPFVFRGSPRSVSGRAVGFRGVGRGESEIARFKGFHGDRVRLVRIEPGEDPRGEKRARERERERTRCRYDELGA